MKKVMSNDKWYLTVSSIAFTVMAIAHLGRIVLNMEAVINGYVVPLELSGLFVVMAGYLAARGFMAATRM